MSRRLQAVIFDMDGTLFDSMEPVTDAFISTILEAGGRRFTPDEIVEAFTVGPSERMMEHLLGRQVTEAEHASYHRRLNIGATAMRPYPGMEAALTALADAGLRLALFTGADVRSLDLLLGRTGLRERFEVRTGGDGAGRAKPDPAGVTLTTPIRVELPLDEDGVAVAWRTLIVLDEGAEAEVWEHCGSADDETDALLNSVVELHVGQAATLRYVSTQDISERAWIFSSQRAQVKRDGRLDWTALGFGSARGKVRMETNLAGAGSEARVTGGYAGGPGQHLDYDTTQEHAAPSTNSDLAFRGVLAAGATAVWRGMIRVDPGAQQTDAFQESRNLLLSPDAHADAIPGLEIEADDVRCTHAAAIAQVDRDQLFYLTSRGLDPAAAKQLIIEGFLESLVERLSEGEVRDELSAALQRRLAEIL